MTVRYGLWWLLLWPAVVAGQTQTRSFSITIAGAGTGSYTQTLKEDHRTGVVELTCTSTVRLKKLIYQYAYDIHAVETWSNGLCRRVECARNDNGDRLAFKAANQVWTSSYHELPAGDWKHLPVLDMDTNTVQQCQLVRVGKDQHGEHYRLTGGLQADLWYDAQGRLCRRVMMRKGRTTTLSLINVKSE